MHDLDRVAIEIHGDDLATRALQLQDVPSSTRSEVQHTRSSQGKRPALDLRQLDLHGAVELLDAGRFVFPEIAVNREHGFRSAVVVVEECAPEGCPARLSVSRIVQGIQGSTSISAGAITRTTGNRPTVSSQKGVRLYHQM